LAGLAPATADPPAASGHAAPARRLRRLIFGPPRDLRDRSLFHRLSLIPLLAWIGLGADPLSSSCYGPEEAFKALGGHDYLALGVAAMTTLTISVIAAAYSRLIEEFPHGGGGYVVASKLLGPHVGVVSGAALLIDYVLTISVSVAASQDALFSFLPAHLHHLKLVLAAAIIVLLTVVNIRGVRESVLVLAPVFLLFLATHLVLIVGGLARHLPEVPSTVRELGDGFSAGLASLGAGGMLALLLHGYSMGGGTYTGLEAVSNGLPIMRAPQVRTGKRTMLYMAVSLAITASGLLVLYLLLGVEPASGKTMNAVAAERLVGGWSMGPAFVVTALISEGALLIVAAQAGFIDGPRVLANMALDRWAPGSFASLSERLTTQNGIVLMGAAAVVTLLATRGDVRTLVVMYSINVFLTFSLSMLGMLRLSWRRRRSPRSIRRLLLFTAGFVLCATILVAVVVEKLPEGGWVTLAVTGAVVALTQVIRRHYRGVAAELKSLDGLLDAMPPLEREPGPINEPGAPTAVVLVAGYGGLGAHTVLNALRMFPGHFQNLVFLSVGAIGSGTFKGEGALDELRRQTARSLEQYRQLARRLGIPSTSRLAVGTDVTDEAEKLCLQVLEEFPAATIFAGKVIFARERWYHRLLHNDTALSVQKRLQRAGHATVVVPAKVG
jgi:amino acid transporter